MHKRLLTDEGIVAMAVSAIAEEIGKPINKIRVKRFHKVSESSLQMYLKNNGVEFIKYKLRNDKDE